MAFEGVCFMNILIVIIILYIMLIVWTTHAKTENRTNKGGMGTDHFYNWIVSGTFIGIIGIILAGVVTVAACREVKKDELSASSDFRRLAQIARDKKAAEDAARAQEALLQAERLLKQTSV